MLGSHLSEMRRSFETQGTLKNRQKQDQIVSRRDSVNIDHKSFGLDVELSDNKKKMLQAFIKSAGIEKDSQTLSDAPSKSSSQNLQYGNHKKNNHGNDEGLEEIAEKPEPGSKISEATTLQKTLNNQSLTLSLSKAPSTYPSLYFKNIHSHSSNLSNQDVETFFRQIFETLGLSSQEDSRLQIDYALNSAYNNFVEMKSNGRWKLIKSHIQGDQAQIEDISEEPQKKSIIKKKSTFSIPQLGSKKKVRVVEPQTLTELQRIYSKMEQNLNTWIDKLTKGFSLYLYRADSLKKQEGICYFSYDFRFLTWQTKSKKPLVVSMSKFNGIADGIQTKNFRRYLKKVKIDQRVAFSLCLGDQSLDFEAISIEEKEELTYMIREVKLYC